MRGPGVVNLDLSLFRTFKLTEQFQLQFRAEAFNVTQHAALRQPERQRQQLELRAGARHAVGGCDRAVAGVPLRVAPDVLVLGFSTSPPGAASNACAPFFCVEAYGGWFAGGTSRTQVRRPELQFRRGTYHGPLTSPCPY